MQEIECTCDQIAHPCNIHDTYVPDTAHIRSGWVYGAREIQIPEHVSGPQFDRWLSGIKAEAREQALLDASEIVLDAAAQGLGLHSAARNLRREAGKQ
jgi:hypothetical protein